MAGRQDVALYRVLMNINQCGCRPYEWLGLDGDRCIRVIPRHPRPGTPPWDQVHSPGTRYTPQTRSPLGPGTPRDQVPPQQGTPRDQVHPPGTRYNPLGPGTPSRPGTPPGPGTPPRTRYTLLVNSIFLKFKLF